MIEGRSRTGLAYAAKRGCGAVAYCALSIRCGTRDEVASVAGPPDSPVAGGRDSAGFPNGTAHFVEHTVFKGTERRNASAINSRLDKLGGELNAYTTKEEIVLHATVLKEDLGKAADLLFELVTCPTFPAGEVETERGVIIDEINSYKDAPAEEIYDVFEEKLFEGHPLSGPILGKVKSVRKITREDLLRFVREKFIPADMAFTVVADIDEAVLARRIETLANKYFGSATTARHGNSNPKDTKGQDNIDPDVRKNPTFQTNMHGGETGQGTQQPVGAGHGAGNARRMAAPPSREPFCRTVNRHSHQVNCIVGGPAPSLYDHADRIAMVLLSNILGGPASNSILNSLLREKRGWVYGVECTYTQYADTGIVAVSLGCEKENLDKCLKAIDRELTKLGEAEISGRRLRAAKKQLLGQIAVSGDNGENQCLSMGKSLLSYGHVLTDEEGRRQIEAVTASDLRRIASRFFSPSLLSTLVFI